MHFRSSDAIEICDGVMFSSLYTGLLRTYRMVPNVNGFVFLNISQKYIFGPRTLHSIAVWCEEFVCLIFVV